MNTAAMAVAGPALLSKVIATNQDAETMVIHIDVKTITDDAHHHPTCKAASIATFLDRTLLQS